MKAEVQTSSLNWPQSNGKPVTCKEKLKILEENKTELTQYMRDVFEDALLIGVDEEFMRDFLKDMVDQLRSPVK